MSERTVAFLCGPDGLTVDVSPPGEDEWVAERRLAWARAYEAGTGEFPDFEAQIDFVVKATDHYRAVVWPEWESVERRRAAMRASVRPPEAL